MQKDPPLRRAGWLGGLLLLSLVTISASATAEPEAEKIRSAVLAQSPDDLTKALDATDFDINAAVFPHAWRDEQFAAIHLAAENGDIESTKRLIAQGASVSIPSSLGNTALHIASRAGHRELAQFLIDAGVDLNLLNLSGQSALSLAQAEGHRQIAAWLSKAGALDDDSVAHSNARVLGTRQVNYLPLDKTFTFFALKPHGDRMVVVDSENRLTVFNPKSGVLTFSLLLSETPVELLAKEDRLFLAYKNRLEVRSWRDLTIASNHNLASTPTAMATVTGQNWLYYSDGEAVYGLNLDTGDSAELHRQWAIRQLDLTTSGKTLFVTTEFTITAIDTDSHEPRGVYNGYNKARYLLEDKLIVLRGDVLSSQETGVSYLSLDEQANKVHEFSIPRTFQQQDVRITQFKGQQILTESFNQIALSGQNGQSFVLAFNEFKFDDFAFHPDVGFALFNPAEIRIVSTSGVINSRLIPNTEFSALKADNSQYKLGFTAIDQRIIVRSALGNKDSLEGSSEVTALATSEKFLAAGYLDGSFSVWKLPSLKLVTQQPYLTGKVSSIYLDEKQKRIFLGGLGRIAVTNYDIGDNQAKTELMFRGHNNFVTALNVSEDGQLLVSSGDDASVKFWHVADNRLAENLALNNAWLSRVTVNDDLNIVGHGPGIKSFNMDAADLFAEMTNPEPKVAVQKANTSQVSKIIIDPTGRYLANNDGASINVRDIKSGMLQSRIFPKAGSVNDFVFSHDGNSLVLVSGEHIEYWDPASGLLQKQVRHGFSGGAFHNVDAIPEINLLLASNMWGWHEPFYIHANSGERRGVWNYLQQVNMQGDGPVDIAISQNGEKIAVFGHKRIHLFKRGKQSFELDHSIPRAKPDVTNQYFRDYLGFSADGKYLRYLSFADQNRVVVWDTDKQTTVIDRPGKLSIFLDHHRLLYMADNVSLNVLDLDTNETKVVSRFEHNDLISALAYNSNEQTFVSADIWGNTMTWDARSLTRIRTLNRFDNDVYTSELSGDGRFLAYTNKQGIHLLDLQNMRLHNLEGNNYPYFGAFSHDNQRFYFRVVGDYHYIDLTSEQLTQTPAFTTPWDPETTKGTEISQDDQYLLFLMDDTYHIYDLVTGSEIKTISKNSMFADNIVFSFMSFDPAQERITGQLVSAPKPGFAQTQLAHFNYQQQNTETLGTPVVYDMSNELEQFTANKDLAINELSPSGRYYAYSHERYLKLIDNSNGELIFNGRKNNLEFLAFDDQEEFLLLVDETGYLEKISITNRSLVARYKASDAKITSIKTSGQYISVLGDDEVINIYDLSTNERIVSIAPRGEDDFIIINPEGYYYATKNAAQLGVAFRKGYKIYPFEQFDLQFNRPDLAFANLIERDILDPSLAEAYTQAYTKRRQQLGALNVDGTPPQLALIRNTIPINTDAARLTLEYLADREVDTIHVWVNNVPLFGQVGIPARKLDNKIEIELSAGRNKIQLAGRSRQGLESLRETVEVFASRSTKPTTHLVVIGASEYQQSARNLNYAVKDASDLTELLANPETRVHMFTNQQVTRENILAVKQALLETQVDDRVILFYAGHGMLTEALDYFLGTFDVDFTSPEKRGLDYKTLEFLFDSIPARNRLMLIDACHSGEADKFALEAVAQVDSNGPLKVSSGTARGLDFSEDETELITPPRLGLQNSFNLSKQLFADIRKDTGVTVISASGSAEFAWEDGNLNNGVFTYSLLKGLREAEADIDGDGAVNISELQSYVRDTVIELTNGLQQPTFRTENIDNDWPVYLIPN